MTVELHDITAGAVRRTLRAKLPPLTDVGFRMAVHRLSDQVVLAALGSAGIAATRVLFVKDGKVDRIDQDGADLQLVSSSSRQAMSPAWAPDGRHFAYMEFAEGHGQLFMQDMATGQRVPRPKFVKRARSVIERNCRTLDDRAALRVYQSKNSIANN